MTDQIERWVVTAEGRAPLRPFMIIEQEQESWARELHANMAPERWVNTKVWRYFDGEFTDVTSAVQASDETAAPGGE